MVFKLAIPLRVPSLTRRHFAVIGARTDLVFLKRFLSAISRH